MPGATRSTRHGLRLRKALMVAALATGIAISKAFAADNTAATEITGELEVIIIDYQDGRSETAFRLNDPASGRSIVLDFEDEPPGDWVTGDKVTVKGVLQGGRIQATEMSRLPAVR